MNEKQNKPIALIGLMGAGKSAIGRRLARRMGRRFVDADAEIEAAAGCSIADIFELYGEAAFRDGERRVIARLLAEDEPIILATGGGAFMNAETRALLKEKAITLWLKADLEVLVERCARKDTRPLLRQEDPGAVLARLMEIREPVYAQADITVPSSEGGLERTVRSCFTALQDYMQDSE